MITDTLKSQQDKLPTPEALPFQFFISIIFQSSFVL